MPAPAHLTPATVGGFGPGWAGDPSDGLAGASGRELPRQGFPGHPRGRRAAFSPPREEIFPSSPSFLFFPPSPFHPFRHLPLRSLRSRVAPSGPPLPLPFSVLRCCGVSGSPLRASPGSPRGHISGSPLAVTDFPPFRVTPSGHDFASAVLLPRVPGHPCADCPGHPSLCGTSGSPLSELPGSPLRDMPRPPTRGERSGSPTAPPFRSTGVDPKGCLRLGKRVGSDLVRDRDVVKKQVAST